MAALWQPFSMAIVYLWSQHNRDAIVTFLFGLKFRALYLPLVLGVVEFLSTADVYSPLMGILVGHVYYFLSVVQVQKDPRWRTRLQAPQWMQRIMPKYLPISSGSSHGFTAKRPGEAFGSTTSSNDQPPSFRPFAGRGQKLGQ